MALVRGTRRGMSRVTLIARGAQENKLPQSHFHRRDIERGRYHETSLGKTNDIISRTRTLPLLVKKVLSCPSY